MAIQRLSSKLVKHGQTLLATFLDSLKGSVDALEVRADATDTKIDDMKNMAVRQVGDQWLHDYRPVMPPNSAPLDGQQVPTTGIYAALHAELVAGKRPTCTEAEWQGDVTKRGCYVINSATGMMRLPDKNGVQPGSLKGTVGKGDSGVIAPGTMQKYGVPNITGTIQADGGLDTTMVTGAFKPVTRPSSTGLSISTNRLGGIEIDTSLVSDAYVTGLDEVRVNSTVGCWVVCLASMIENVSEIDAVQLASNIAANDARISTIEGRNDYARIDIPAGVALNTRTVYTNPFGEGTPVHCEVEIQHTAEGWVTTPWLFSSASGSHGSTAGAKDGVGIVLRTATTSYVGIASDSGSTGAFTSVYTTRSPMRIHVYRAFGS